MKKAIILMIALCVFVSFSLASVQGTIKGTAKDKAGNPIEGVQVSIISMEYAAVNLKVKTNQKGEFIQIGLQPGYYQIKAEKDGYFPVQFERRVLISDIVDASFEMEEGKYYVSESPGEKDFKTGNEWFAQEKYEEAAKSYQKAIENEPEEPIYYNNLGTVYLRLEKLDEAIEIYKKMLEIQPESYSANKMLGETYGFKQEYREALPYFQRAVDLSPDDPDAFFNLGACLMNTGANSQALEAFTKTIELKPDYALAYYQVGMLYVNQNRKEEAIQNLEKFLELAPSDPNAAVAEKIIEYLKSN